MAQIRCCGYRLRAADSVAPIGLFRYAVGEPGWAAVLAIMAQLFCSWIIGASNDHAFTLCRVDKLHKGVTKAGRRWITIWMIPFDISDHGHGRFEPQEHA